MWLMQEGTSALGVHKMMRLKEQLKIKTPRNLVWSMMKYNKVEAQSKAI
jgi:hypothetical protein